MKLIITEKPSVAFEIAKTLKINERADGYLYTKNNSDYAVSWALGHLVQLAAPKVYNSAYAKWTLADLPIIPAKFQYELNDKTKKQFNVLKKLVKQANSLICATDAGREGELIFRLIYKLIADKKPVQRLWISSLTPKAIQTGFNNLEPISNYNNLYAAAMGRQVADWLVGLNATRALSLKAGGETLLSVGRVQTPTLRLVVERYLEHINFKPEPFWQPELNLDYKDQPFIALYHERLTDREAVEKICRAIENLSSTQLIDVEKKERREQAPLLYDLTGLQKKANKLFGYSAKQTLSIAQKLYESKLITYPRSDSKYLTGDMKGSMADILKKIAIKKLQPALETINLKQLKFSKRYFNDAKVTDHHAIIATGMQPRSLSETENNIYKLVVASLLMAFMEDCIKLNTNYYFEPGGYQFISKGTVILKEGWRLAELFSKEDKEEKQLPEIPLKADVKIVSIENKTKQTKAPPLLTVATLLALMENAGKLVEEEVEEVLQKFGIGTPATRAGIIDILFKRNYIIQKGKSLLPVETGIMLYHLTKDLYISNVEMTGEWEYKLKQIEMGEQPVQHFKERIESYTTKIVEQIKTMEVERSDLKECPKCRQKKLLYKTKLLSCVNNNCDFVLWKKIAGKILSEKQIADLLSKGYTRKLKGFKNKQGKKFDAALALGAAFKVSFQF